MRHASKRRGRLVPNGSRAALVACLALLASAPAPTPAQDFDPFVPMAMALSADGRLLATSQLTRRGVPGGETTVTDTRTGKQLYKIRWEDRTTSALAFSADGRRLALGGGDNIEAGVWVGVVEVVGADSGRRVFRQETKLGIIRHVAFSGDGKRLATHHADSLDGPQLQVLDAETGRIHETLRVGELKLDGRKDETGGRYPFFHPDGRLLINPGWGKKVFDARGKPVYEVTLRHGPGIRAVTFGNEAKTAILLEQTAFFGPGHSGLIENPGVVHLCDAKTGRPMTIIEGHTKQILCTAMSADGRRLVTGSTDKTVKL
jgi:WD40 repeat protein